MRRSVSGAIKRLRLQQERIDVQIVDLRGAGLDGELQLHRLRTPVQRAR
jgi:hypothetical protein